MEVGVGDGDWKSERGWVRGRRGFGLRLEHRGLGIVRDSFFMSLMFMEQG